MFQSDKEGIRGMPNLAWSRALKTLVELRHVFPLGLRNGV